MDNYSFDDIDSIWLKPVERCYISPEEINDINIISNILISEISNSVNNVATKIIYKELKKRPKASLCQQLLIKRQIINNIYENITNITINMAKEKLDNIKIDEAFKENYIEMPPIFEAMELDSSYNNQSNLDVNQYQMMESIYMDNDALDILSFMDE